MKGALPRFEQQRLQIVLYALKTLIDALNLLLTAKVSAARVMAVLSYYRLEIRTLCRVSLTFGENRQVTFAMRQFEHG
jgi:hypothetical protein